jgi:methyl-accepting chemotaxis protein
MEQITNDYTNRLREMTTQLERYTAQAKLMSIDSAEVHEQTRRMAAQMEELNNVYARMIEAMNNKK